MPANNSSTGRTFSRHVAPFAPLALALMMHGVPSPKGGPTPPQTPTAAEAVTCEEVTDFQDCHTRYPAGCSAGAGYDPALNLLKNALIQPPGLEPGTYFTKLDDFKNLDAQIPAGLTAHNHADYKDELEKIGEGQPYGLVGYLYYFQPTSAESTNCQLTGPTGESNPQDNYTNVDYHIGIGFDPPPNGKPDRHSLQQNSVIVEMTPYSRFLYKDGIWTLENLQKAQGKFVRVVGQLMVDSEHNLPFQNCALAKTAGDLSKCWRASVWELHPVVRFQVCSTNSCTAKSNNWQELNQLP